MSLNSNTFSHYSQYEIPDPYVSNTHIRIYTIIFDQDVSYDVAPLVYAEDLSRNGTLLNGHLMGIGNGGFLLRQDDVLSITRDISIRFNSATCVSDRCFSDIQMNEIQVSLYIGLSDRNLSNHDSSNSDTNTL